MSQGTEPARDPIAEAKRQWIAHGWASAADGMEMVTSLVRVHQLLDDRIDAVLRSYDLTFARYEILRLLSFTRNGLLPMSKLGSLLQVHAASVTSAVGRLERQGFVTRKRSDADGRVVLASITRQGRSTVDRATVDLNADVFSNLPMDVTGLTDLLTAYRRHSGDIGAGEG